MNRIDQALVCNDGEILDTSIDAGEVIDFGVAGTDRDGKINGVMHLDLGSDDGTDDAAAISCTVVSDGNAAPSTTVATIFNGTLAQYKASVEANNDRVRAGLNSVLGRYAQIVVTCSIDTPLTVTTYFEPTE